MGDENINQEELVALDNQKEISTIDYVLVFKEDSKKIDNYFHNLKINGLEIQIKESGQLKFALIKIKFEKCLEMAKKMKLKLPVEDIKIREKSCKFSLFSDKENFFEKPRTFYSSPYDPDIHSKFEKYFNKENSDETFRSRDRILLTYEILARTKYSKKLEEPTIFSIKKKHRNFGIESLLSKKIMLDAYPLHKEISSTKPTLTRKKFLLNYTFKPKYWLRFQPLYVIRNYLGEKIAFYFAWLSFYTSWLILPSIVGIAVFIYGLFTFGSDVETNQICDKKKLGNLTMCPRCDNEIICPYRKLADFCLYSKISYFVDNPVTILYSIFMCFWTVLFIEFWKRKEFYYQYEWEVFDFEKTNEPIRLEFEKNCTFSRENSETGELEPYILSISRCCRRFFSLTIVILMVCIVFSVVIGLIFLKASLMLIPRTHTDPYLIYSTTLILRSSITLAVMYILSNFYSWLAVKLTNIEMHQTDSNYERALTLKIYLFEFFNHYASIFYTAFFMENHCNRFGCLSELCIQLAFIMAGKQIYSNVQEIILPTLKNFWKRHKADEQHKKIIKKEKWLKDFYLITSSKLLLCYEYSEMAIQYGFITIFAVAFPLGPLFALLNNVFEIRIDAFKFLTQYKRPLPKKAQNIGIWLRILNFVSKLSIITNGLIIAFISEVIPRFVFRVYENGKKIHAYGGYVFFTLSKESFTRNGVKTECYYKSFKDPFDLYDNYEYKDIYYYVLYARILFFIVFEVFIFSIVAILHYIPSMPKSIQKKIDDENSVV